MKADDHTFIRLEQQLFTATVRSDPERLEELLADDFLEIGASGRRWTKTEIIADVIGEGNEPAPSHEMQAVETRVLTADLVLLIYRVVVSSAGQRLRASERSSLWRRETAGWRMVFHQGTVTQE